MATELAFNIKRFRLSKNMSREDVAKKLGVTEKFIAHIEQGHRKPSLEKLYKLRDIFEVEMMDFFDNIPND